MSRVKYCQPGMARFLSALKTACWSVAVRPNPPVTSVSSNGSNLVRSKRRSNFSATPSWTSWMQWISGRQERNESQLGRLTVRSDCATYHSWQNCPWPKRRQPVDGAYETSAMTPSPGRWYPGRCHTVPPCYHLHGTQSKRGCDEGKIVHCRTHLQSEWGQQDLLPTFLWSYTRVHCRFRRFLADVWAERIWPTAVWCHLEKSEFFNAISLFNMNQCCTTWTIRQEWKGVFFKNYQKNHQIWLHKDLSPASPAHKY